ncbi:hypothetical protein DFJ74DRAFT_658773 [Hyaloraphidium curvatum]|nr:hypothetical protein DFJ74DRAFT_658773 [Hyaloraphidium curvatum]
MSTAAAHRIALLAVLIAAFALLGPSRSESGLAFRANGVSAAGVQRFPVMRVSKRQYGLDANDDDDDEGDDDDDDDDDDSDERRRLQRRQRRQKKSKKTKTAKKKKTAKKAPKKKKTTKKKTTKNKKDTKKAKKEKTTKGGCVPKGIRGRLPKPLPASCTPALLEQYCNVAKNQKDPACADLLGCVPKKGLMGSAKLPDPLPASCTPEKLAAYCAKPTSSKDPACGDASNCVPDTEDEVGVAARRRMRTALTPLQEGNMILSNPPAPECNPASLKAYCKSLGSAKNVGTMRPRRPPLALLTHPSAHQSEPQCASGLSRAIKSVKKAVSGAFAAFAPQIQELGTMIGIENYTPLRFATDFGPILVQSKGDAKKMARAVGSRSTLLPRWGGTR